MSVSRRRPKVKDGPPKKTGSSRVSGVDRRRCPVVPGISIEHVDQNPSRSPPLALGGPTVNESGKDRDLTPQIVVLCRWRD